MLEVYLQKFKELTIYSIEALEKENLDLLDNLIQQRQELINSMKSEEYDSEEFKKLVLKLDVMELEKKLENLASKKRDYAKQQITNMQRSKQAHKIYNRSFTNKAYFLKEER